MPRTQHADRGDAVIIEARRRRATCMAGGISGVGGPRAGRSLCRRAPQTPHVTCRSEPQRHRAVPRLGHFGCAVAGGRFFEGAARLGTDSGVLCRSVDRQAGGELGTGATWRREGSQAVEAAADRKGVGAGAMRDGCPCSGGATVPRLVEVSVRLERDALRRHGQESLLLAGFSSS